MMQIESEAASKLETALLSSAASSPFPHSQLRQNRRGYSVTVYIIYNHSVQQLMQDSIFITAKSHGQK